MASAAAADESSKLTEIDYKFLELAFTCLKSVPELDIMKLSDKMGIKPKSVMNRWCEVRKKLFADAPVDDEYALEMTPKTKAKPKAKAKPKRKAVEEPDGERATPKKTPRRSTRQTATSSPMYKEPEEFDFDMDDDDEDMSGHSEDGGI